MSNDRDINTGVLFINDKGTNPKAPDRKGSINIDGVEYWASGWLNRSQKGDPYLALKFTIKEGHTPNRNGIRDQLNPKPPAPVPEPVKRQESDPADWDQDDYGSIPF